MSVDDLNSVRYLIDSLRRRETQLFEKLHSPTQSSRKEDILKIGKDYQKEHKTVLKLINDLQTLYEVKTQIEELEKKK